MKTALVSGTFDPITVGHTDVIRRASALFDRVIVAVMDNQNKMPLFDADTRVTMTKKAVGGIENVQVVREDGRMVEAFDRLGADVIVRGIRNETDAQYETYMATYLHEHNPHIETVFFACDPALCAVSSSEVRRRIAKGEPLDGLVPREILPYFDSKKSI